MGVNVVIVYLAHDHKFLTTVMNLIRQTNFCSARVNTHSQAYVNVWKLHTYLPLESPIVTFCTFLFYSLLPHICCTLSLKHTNVIIHHPGCVVVVVCVGSQINHDLIVN